MYHLAYPNQAYCSVIYDGDMNDADDLVDRGYLQYDPNSGVEGEFFTYDIASTSPYGPPTTSTFTARAIRNSGANQNEFITIDQNGALGGDFTPGEP